MARKYEQRRRAEKQEETRRRITEAAAELHGSVGPAKTTISAIADKAGVQRLTVYRHFPDERSLIAACSEHWSAANPLPDPPPWREIRDPEARLRTVLGEVYAYYGRTGGVISKLLRDAPEIPFLAEMMQDFGEYFAVVRDILATGWGARGKKRVLLLGAIDHALEFETWRSLVCQHGLDDEQAIELMVGMARCATRG